MIDRHFEDIKDVIAIHENLIISAVSLRKHDKTLRNILEKAKNLNTKFNIKKIKLRVPEVTYLGNIYSKEGLKPCPEKGKAIFKIPQPRNKYDTQQVIGMVNYLGQYIPNLSKISYPLLYLLQNGVSWHWSQEHYKALK